MKVMVAGGGTGGHLFPCLAVVERLKELGHEVFYVGSSFGLEGKKRELLPEKHYLLPVKGVRGKGLKSLSHGLFLFLNTLRSFSILSSFKPDRVVLFGGYVSFPLGLASVLKGVPLFIQEQNTVPGRTNLLLSRFAKRVFVGFKSSLSYFGERGVFTGNPVRREILRAVENRKSLKGRVLKKLSLSEKKRTLLVIGGSQGALWLNETMKEVAKKLSPFKERLQVIHVAGAGKSEGVEEAYKKAGIECRVFEFYERVWELYAVADVALSRAGALTVSELSLFGIPTLFVPFPFAVDDHQYLNAEELFKSGGCLLRRQEELTPKKVFEDLRLLLFDIIKAREISEVMKRFAVPDSTERVVREIVNG